MYEVFNRKDVRRGVPSVTVTAYGRITISASATHWLSRRECKFVLLLWDPEAKRIGIQPAAEEDRRTYRVNYTRRKSGAGLSAQGFLDHIRINREVARYLPAEWNEGRSMIEVVVPPGMLRPQDA